MQNEWIDRFRFWKDKRFRLCFAWVFLFGLIAHGFCYFSLSYTHDSLYCIYRTDLLSHIGYGRFLQPLYSMLRGNLSLPWLCGLLTFLWIALALYCLVDLLRIRQSLTVVLLAAAMTTYPMLSITNATYLNFTDLFMLAFLLSVISVWLLERVRWGFLAGAVCVMLSMGLYQNYIASACGLILILFILKILRGETDTKQLWTFAVKAAAMLLLGALLYTVTLKVALSVTGVELATTYNGIADVGNFQDVSLLALIKDTYTYLLKTLYRPHTALEGLTGVLNGLLLLAGLLALFAMARKSRLTRGRLALLVAALLMLPFAVNVTYFISKGVIHEMMTYPFVLLTVLALTLVDQSGWMEKEPESRKKKNVQKALCVALPAIVFLTAFSDTVYANTAYLKKQLEYQSTFACMNRVINEMEHTEGFALRETPVVFVGTLSDSAVSQNRTGMDYLRGVGLTFNYGITYYETELSYMEYVMGYPVRLADYEIKRAYRNREDVAAMPAFPSAGYCQLLDGVLVVKLSQP